MAGEEAEKRRLRSALEKELGEFLAQGRAYPFPPCERPSISAVIVAWNQAAMTLRCLKALQQARLAGAELEAILIDNASSDETARLIGLFPGLRVFTNRENKGFVLACNQGAKEARGRHILVVNNDAAPRPGTVERALALLDADPSVGAVGARIVLPDGTLQEAGSIVWSDGTPQGYCRGQASEAPEAMFRRDVDFCSGAFLLTPIALWQRLNGFDEAFRPAYFEDTDYCLKVWAAGYRVLYDPLVLVDHYEYASQRYRGQAHQMMEHRLKIFRKLQGAALKKHPVRDVPGNEIVARHHWRTRRPNLLVIDDQVPLAHLGSGLPRMRCLLHEAFQAGWQITFLSLNAPLPPSERVRQALPWEIECLDGTDPARLEELLKQRANHLDCILVSRPTNMHRVGELLDQARHARIVYDAEAVFAKRAALEAQVHGRPLSPERVEEMLEHEVQLASRADCLIAVSQKEAAFFRSRISKPVHLLSHALRKSEHSAPFAQRENFLFVGRLMEKDQPNWQGLAWFIKEIWPRIRQDLPAAQLVVAGMLNQQHEELQAPGVELLGMVEDLAPLYDRARVFVAPVHFAAGLPLKVLEASAAGLPTLATALMADQLEWRDGEEIAVAKTVDEWVKMALRLHGDESFWRRIASAVQERALAEHGEELFNRRVREILPPAYVRRDGGPNPPADGV